jgi:hypothetical protein
MLQQDDGYKQLKTTAKYRILKGSQPSLTLVFAGQYLSKK